MENRHSVTGLLMIFIGTGFLTTMMLAAAIAEDYNFTDSAISDLGVEPATRAIFNIVLIFVGLLNMSAGYLLYIDHQRKGLLVTYFIAGIGAIGTGIFPLNTGGIHSLFALSAFIFFNIQTLMSTPIIENIVFKIISILFGSIGLLYVVIMFIGDNGLTEVFAFIGHGGSERMIVYPPMMWLIIMGGYLLGKNHSS